VICSLKSFSLVSIMMYYRVVPCKLAIDMPFDNKKRENLMEISRKLGKLEAEKDYQNALTFGGLLPEDLLR
jgi:hypothetical protein